MAQSGMPLYAGPKSTSYSIRPELASAAVFGAAVLAWGWHASAMVCAYAFPSADSSDAVLKDPELKKYGEIRPDFTLNVPNLRIL